MTNKHYCVILAQQISKKQIEVCCFEETNQNVRCVNTSAMNWSCRKASRLFFPSSLSIKAQNETEATDLMHSSVFNENPAGTKKTCTCMYLWTCGVCSLVDFWVGMHGPPRPCIHHQSCCQPQTWLLSFWEDLDLSWTHPQTPVPLVYTCWLVCTHITNLTSRKLKKKKQNQTQFKPEIPTLPAVSVLHGRTFSFPARMHFNYSSRCV